jgi:uncharacterized protein YyaL (SSP411 family)
VSATADRPLFIVVGEACDWWSQQLAAEIMADTEFVAVLDEVFVPLVADRQEQPALAARVEQALAVAGHEGSPAVALALPDGRVFGALPYTPVRDRDKRVGLARIVIDVAERWLAGGDDVRADAERMAAIAAHFDTVGDDRGLPALALTCDRAEAEAMAAADTLEGGFAGGARYHRPALLAFLTARAALDSAPPALLDQVARTYDALIAGAVHDHLAGGFFHAGTDSGWNQSLHHKLLVDNAQLVPLLLAAADPCQRSMYRDVALHTLDWCLTALALPSGYARGVHAGSAGANGVAISGAAYAWSAAAAAAVVGSDGGALFARRYLADERCRIGEEWAIPAVRGALTPEELARMPELCQRLLVARGERPLPAVDARAPLADQAQLLCAVQAALIVADEERYRTAAAALVANLSPVDPATVGDNAAVAWLGRALAGAGVVAGAVACAEVLAGRLDAAGRLPLVADQAAVAALDRLDAPAAVAVYGHLLLDLAPVAAGPWLARVDALLEAHAGVLRAAPLSVAGLLAVWQRRVRG